MTSLVRRAADGAAFAVTFLTVVPLRASGRGAAAAPAFFALVGALIGAVAGAVHAAAHPLLGAPVASVLAVTALVVLTGGLHHDGLADCADAIGVRGGRERRLEVMREPAVGSYGILALVLWALLMVAALSVLAPRDAALALVGAAATGRFAALLHAIGAPAARPEGLGASFAPSWAAVLASGVTAALVALAAAPTRAPAALLAALLVAAGVSVWARRRLGGRTGDTLGATVVLTEAAVVLALSASPQDA